VGLKLEEIFERKRAPIPPEETTRREGLFFLFKIFLTSPFFLQIMFFSP
jgi:hypothetical protein